MEFSEGQEGKEGGNGFSPALLPLPPVTGESLRPPHLLPALLLLFL